MAVRDVLMQAGVEPQRIHTRLLVGHTGRASGQSVFIVIEQELTDEK